MNSHTFQLLISTLLRLFGINYIDQHQLNGLRPPGTSDALTAARHLPSYSGPTTYTSYILGPVCTPSEKVRHPSTVQEIISIVHEALERNTAVKAIGAKHSATDIICTNGIPVDMKGITGMEYHSQSKTVTVGAGVYLRELYLFLEAEDRALNTIPGFAFITVGGAIGTGAHGSSIKHKSTISAQVIGMDVVDGLGQLRSICDEDTLNAFRIHLGLLGIIVSVTLETVPLYKVHVHNYVMSDEILRNGEAIRLAKEVDHLSLNWFPSYDQVIVFNRTNLAGDPKSIPGNAYTSVFAPPITPLFSWVSTRSLEVAQKLNSTSMLNIIQAYSAQSLLRKVPYIGAYYTEDGYRSANPGIGTYHNALASSCTDSGWTRCWWLHGPPSLLILDNEVIIELKELPAFIRDAKEILREAPAMFPAQGVLLRFSGASNIYLSPSYGADSVHVEWFVPKRRDPYETASSGIGTYQAMMQTLVKKYSGRSHWGKSGFYYHSKEVLDTKISASLKDKFLKKMKEFDPHGIFLNDFGRRLKGEGTIMNLDPSTTHCALLDNCICSKDTDCAPQQQCGKIHEFPVCLPP